MRRTFAFLGVLAVALATSLTDARACGDKFLVVGRGVRYQRVHAAAHPASILIYMNPASHVPAAAKDVQLEASLKQAGHTVQQVQTAGQLDDALKAKKYDVVLADIADSPGLEKQMGSAASRPSVVPILYHPTADEVSQAKKQYGCALKAPNPDPLAAIDEAMSQRLHSADASAGKAK
jgi:hypothetical protein